MKIFIKVKTNARKNEVEQLDASNYKVSVSVPPVEGKANEKVIELISKHFGCPKSRCSIVSGHKSKTKVIEILTV